MPHYAAKDMTDVTAVHFGTTTPPPRPDRRRGDRHLSVLRVAKLTVGADPARGRDGREMLCLIRDVSAGGMMARTYAGLVPGTAVIVELRPGHRVDGVIAWAEDGAVGISFVQRIDVLRLLGHDEPTDAPPRNQRLPRLAVDVPVEICVDNRALGLTITNISVGGIRVDGRPTDILAVDDRVIVGIEGFGRLAGVVRWRGADSAGIAFLPALSIRALSHWALAHEPARH